MSLRGGYYYLRRQGRGRLHEPATCSAARTSAMAGVPAEFQAPGRRLQNVPTNSSNTRDKQKRVQRRSTTPRSSSRAAASTSSRPACSTTVGQRRPLRRDRRTCVRLYWNRVVGGQRGQYGYYKVRSNGVLPEQGFVAQGEDHTQQARPLPPGLLDDRQPLDPEPRPPHRERERPVLRRRRLRHRPERDRVQLRRQARAARGLRVGRQGRRQAARCTAAGASSTTSSSSSCPRGSFGGDKWLEYYYSLDTPNWPTRSTSRAARRRARARCSAARSTSATRRTTPSDAIDPDIKPMKMQEFVVGADHELSSDALGRPPLRAQADRPRDRGHRRPRRRGQRDLHDRQPGFGPTRPTLRRGERHA